MSFDDYEAGRLARVHRAEPIAQAFHEAYEQQAPHHGYETRPESAVPWADVPENNKALMIAVVNRLIDQRTIYTPTAYEVLKGKLGGIQSTLTLFRDLLNG